MARTSSRTDGRPAFQFYPADWTRERGLGLCSLAARGLWIEMLCVMFDAKPRGYLKLNGSKLEANDLARIVRADVAQVTQLLTELGDRGVYETDDDGTVYCRRMVRDAQISGVRAEAGRRGGRKAKPKQTPSKTKAKPKQLAEGEEANKGGMQGGDDNSALLQELVAYLIGPTPTWRQREDVEQLLNGFGDKACRAALQVCRNKPTRAMSYFEAVLRNGFDLSASEPTESWQTGQRGPTETLADVEATA